MLFRGKTQFSLVYELLWQLFDVWVKHVLLVNLCDKFLILKFLYVLLLNGDLNPQTGMEKARNAALNLSRNAEGVIDTMFEWQMFHMLFSDNFNHKLYRLFI